MSAVSSSRRWASFLLLGVIASLTVTGIMGCGGEKEVDPYVYASLRAVMHGDTLSPGFLFEVEAPQFDYVSGNTAIVRDGNLLEFMVGHNLESNHASYEGTLLGVQKFFRPTPHLMIKRVKRSGVAQDVDSCTSFVVPRILRPSRDKLELPGADLPGLKWNDKKDYATFVPEEEGNDPIEFQTAIETFLRAPRHDLPDSVRAIAGPEQMAWYAVFEESTFEIVELSPGAEWMFNLLQAKDLPLVGSFTVTEIKDAYRERKETYGDLGHVLGKVKANWFRYANTFVEGTSDF